MKMAKYVIGIDEAGRGPLAGPVAVAAVAVSKKFKPSSKLPKLRDSKKLSQKQREKWFGFIKNQPDIFFAVSKVFPRTIERINISRAANLAAKRALYRLCSNKETIVSLLDNREKGLGAAAVILDGGLKLPKHILHKTVIKGDEKYNCVKLASIAAKVTRDRLMFRLHKRYPRYRFDRHKGYGTKLHIELIKQFGLSEVHRLTFLGKYNKVKK